MIRRSSVRARVSHRLVAVAALAGALMAVATAPAGAHGPTGTFAVEATPDADDPASITYRARLTYDNDGDPVEGTEVIFQAAGSGPNAPFAPENMTETDPGVYELTETFPGPGAYTVTIASTTPTASFETTATIEAQATPTTTTNGDRSTTTGSSDDDDDDDDTTIPWLGIAIAVVVVVAVVGAVLVARRRRRG